MSLLWQTVLQAVIPVTAGFVLDLVLGDPSWLYHPVRLIGHLIARTEKIIRNCFPDSKAGERAGGTVLVLIVVIVSTAVPFFLLYFAYRWGMWPGILAESFMCCQLFAVKSLRTESDKVYRALKEEGLIEGRLAVSMIVGRDTEKLSEKGVIKAAVETVAENTSDGVIAPMLYMAIGGAALGFAYKAVNTMDSMVGYNNERYRYFGTAAAKLDDVMNYIPARISAWLMIAAARLCGMDGKGALRIYKRDRQNHKSPNAAQTESVMAGALSVQLAGDAWYFGNLCKKPAIGDAVREVETEDIRRAHVLLYGTSVLGILAFTAVKILALALCAL